MAGTVIIGGGQAAAQTAISLRAGGYGEPIRIIGEEPQLPYQRPPLSKAYMLGKQDAAGLELKPAAYYAENAITLDLGRRVVGIDRQAGCVARDGAAAVAFDHLVIATGARNRPLPLEGAGAENVFSLRDLRDADRIKAALEQVETVAVIGGGFIGLEFAAVARQTGRAVSLIEAQPRLLARAVSQRISDFYADEHRRHGIDLRLGTQVRALMVEAGNVRALDLTDGTRLACDMLVYGIGVLPNAELARDAGLGTDNGILVDAATRTADPRIFAVGDISAHPNPFVGGVIRLESVQNAIDQGKCAAAAILGQVQPYDSVPWFWSDQFDLKLQIAGLSQGFDEVIVRGDRGARRFSAFYLRQGRLIAVDSINCPADHMIGRRLLQARRSPSAAALRDPAFDLKSALAA